MIDTSKDTNLGKQYYECHITMMGDAERIERITKNMGWKFSAIDGDPTLGVGVKCYATKQYNKKQPLEWVIAEVTTTAEALRMIHHSIRVIREKVEMVIYDKMQRNGL